MTIHENDIDYKTQAKQYVLNMIRGSKKQGKWTLHIKNTIGCYWSQYLLKYADFDTIEQVENCGENYRKCKNCFKEEH